MLRTPAGLSFRPVNHSTPKQAKRCRSCRLCDADVTSVFGNEAGDANVSTGHHGTCLIEKLGTKIYAICHTG